MDYKLIAKDPHCNYAINQLSGCKNITDDIGDVGQWSSIRSGVLQITLVFVSENLGEI